jgi:hypothetical protein
MWADLDVHTSSTLGGAENELLRFSVLLKVSAWFSEHCRIDVEIICKEYADSMVGITEKKWNFPKAHSHQHAFADVQAKGATQNFVTKYNEKKHGPLKKAYLGQTNFKDFADQAQVTVHYSRK